MKHIPDPLQPLALPHNSSYQPDPEWIAHELERLELLVPEVAHIDGRDLQTYALAYVEHYQGNVLQLYHAWEFLYVALTQAWQRAEYTVVVRLVTALAYPADRFSNFALAEHILQLGIEASRHIQDREHLASFLNRLGCLLYSHGKYPQGRRVWRTSLELAASSGSPSVLWEPLSSFAHIADILGSYTEVQQFVETLQNVRQINAPDSFAVAVFIRGFYARFANDLEGAYKDFSCCLRLLSHSTPNTPLSASRQLFTMAVQAELARVQGNYARSQEYTESALSLAQIFGDRYTVVDLLIDQINFAYRQGQFVDAQVALLRLCGILHPIEVPHLYRRYRFLEQRLAEHIPESCGIISKSQDQSISAITSARLAGLTELAGLREPELLSDREREVLQLVAEGLSNQEIAKRLVITSGTVKKHLEHIYTKLDGHSRTSAVAKARTLKLLP